MEKAGLYWQQEEIQEREGKLPLPVSLVTVCKQEEPRQGKKVW
jgi:hypothetical protein